VTVAGLVAVVGLLAVAAARPEIVRSDVLRVRSDAEAYVVIDTTRSMLAARTAQSPTRFERARTFALDLRDRLADVPFGLASLTDRVLPHLLPSPDRSTFAGVLADAIGIDRPPPQIGGTQVGSLDAAATDGFFRPHVRHKLVVVITDGESAAYQPPILVGALRKEHVGLIVVRTWNARERVFLPGGKPDPHYRPSTLLGLETGELARLTKPRRAFGDGDVAAVAATARRLLGTGPTVVARRTTHRYSLAPLAVLAAAIPALLLLLRRGGMIRAWGGRSRFRLPLSLPLPSRTPPASPRSSPQPASDTSTS
jgi:hypothetical protein